MALLKRSPKPKTARRKREEPSGIEPLPSWIIWGRWAVPLIALLLIGGLAFTRFKGAAPKELIGGAVVNGRQLAPDFTLVNQFGEPQQLSTFRGKPVALTFIYTNCIDVCPLIAYNM